MSEKITPNNVTFKQVRDALFQAAKFVHEKDSTLDICFTFDEQATAIMKLLYDGKIAKPEAGFVPFDLVTKPSSEPWPESPLRGFRTTNVDETEGPTGECNIDQDIDQIELGGEG
jgi:hypothetical protein